MPQRSLRSQRTAKGKSAEPSVNRSLSVSLSLSSALLSAFSRLGRRENQDRGDFGNLGFVETTGGGVSVAIAAATSAEFEGAERRNGARTGSRKPGGKIVASLSWTGGELALSPIATLIVSVNAVHVISDFSEAVFSSASAHFRGCCAIARFPSILEQTGDARRRWVGRKEARFHVAGV